MKYIVMEIQKFEDGSIAVPPISSFDDYFEAASRYHTILATAAVSNVPVHTCTMLTETGQELALETFNHVDGQIE